VLSDNDTVNGMEGFFGLQPKRIHDCRIQASCRLSSATDRNYGSVNLQLESRVGIFPINGGEKKNDINIINEIIRASFAFAVITAATSRFDTAVSPHR